MDLDGLKSDWLGRIGAATDEAALEELRVAALGKKGEISLKMRELGGMSPEQRQVAAPATERAEGRGSTRALAAKKAALADAALDERLKAEWLDVTLPARNPPRGTIHPVSQVPRRSRRSLPTWALPWPRPAESRPTGTNFDALNIPGHQTFSPGAPRWTRSTR